MMILESLAHNLPEPDIAQRGAEFTIAFWRDWLTDEALAGLKLNERQLKAIPVIRRQPYFSNSDYQAVAGTTRGTAKRDLEEL